MPGERLDRRRIVALVRLSGLAVLATRGLDGFPQAALVGVAATDRGDVVFDTSRTSRKFRNLGNFPQVSLVVLFDREEVTLQLEGTAAVPAGGERQECLRAYLRQYPNGRDRAADSDVTLIQVRLSWARLTDYRPSTAGTWEAELRG